MCSNASSGLLCNQRDCNLITSVMWVSISGTTTKVMEGVSGRILRRLGQGRVRFSVHFWHHMKQNTSLQELFQMRVISKMPDSTSQCGYLKLSTCLRAPPLCPASLALSVLVAGLYLYHLCLSVVSFYLCKRFCPLWYLCIPLVFFVSLSL